jgi:hypothetical protein
VSTAQVNFRIDKKLAEQLRRAADNEDLPRSYFTRKLVTWALQHYDGASSLWVLRQAVVTLPKFTMTKSWKATPRKTRRDS